MSGRRLLEYHEKWWFSFFISFLNRLELEISILSWQRSQPLDSDLEFYLRKSLRVQIKNTKLVQ